MKVSELSGFDINKAMHAYLIISADSSLAREYSELLASALVCSAPDKDGCGCGKCSGCIIAAAHTHPDIAHLGKDKVSVDDIRSLKNDVYLASNESDRKLFILQGVDKFNVQSQNALLKVLEEPPSGVVFILSASSRSSILSTVLSRCCILTPSNFDFSHYKDEVAKHLGKKSDETSTEIIASYLSLYGDTDLEALDTDAVLSAYSSAIDYLSGQNPNILTVLPEKSSVKGSDKEKDSVPMSKAKEEKARKDANSRSRGNLAVILRTFMLLTRNITVYKQSMGKCKVYPCDDRFRKICVRLSAKRAVQYYEMFEKAYMLSESNANPNALFAYLSKGI